MWMSRIHWVNSPPFSSKCYARWRHVRPIRPQVGQAAPGFAPLPVPVLAGIPVLGPILFVHDPLVYLSYLLPPLFWLFFTKSRPGLHLRAAG